MEGNQADRFVTGLTNKSENHRTGEVEKDLWGAPSSTPRQVRENGDKTKITQNQCRAGTTPLKKEEDNLNSCKLLYT